MGAEGFWFLQILSLSLFPDEGGGWKWNHLETCVNCFSALLPVFLWLIVEVFGLFCVLFESYKVMNCINVVQNSATLDWNSVRLRILGEGGGGGSGPLGNLIPATGALLIPVTGRHPVCTLFRPLLLVTGLASVFRPLLICRPATPASAKTRPRAAPRRLNF